MSLSKRVLVVGGGLAGSMAACRLQAAGWQVLLADDKAPGSASPVAAGLYNVITGRLGAKTWMADAFLAALHNWLAEPAFQGARQFVHPLPIYRPFQDLAEYNAWMGKSAEPGFASLVKIESNPLFPEWLHNPWGGLLIQPCGWVDIAGLVAWLQETLVVRGGRLLSGTLDYQDLDWENKYLSWAGERIRVDQIVHCEGYRIREHPLFEALSIRPNKGEILDVRVPGLPELPFALSKKAYLVPGRQPGHWVVGSTYRNEFEGTEPTEEGRNEILAQLSQVLLAKVEVVGQRAGIRPTTPNRRPVLGTHPAFPWVHVLTGFGTKGMLAAPFSTALLTEMLEGLQPAIPGEMSLGRFAGFSQKG